MHPDDSSPDDALVGLLRRSGRRELPPDEVSQQVYASTLTAWQAQQRRRRALRVSWSIAAGLAATAFVIWLWRANLFAPEFGTLEAGNDLQISSSRFVTPWNQGSWNQKNTPLRVGDTLTTSAAGARIRRSDGTALRLDSHTSLRITSPTLLQLERGRVAVDTGRSNSAHQALVVRTSLADVAHVGTQFLVDLSGRNLSVAVRDGRVAVTTNAAQQLTLTAGEAVQIDLGGRPQRRRLGPFDAGWQWADALARPISVEGRSLDAVLNDVAERSGLYLTYANDGAASKAHRIMLHGPDLLLSPRIALDAALAGTTLSVAIRDRELVIQER